jgi:hypothetical protein
LAKRKENPTYEIMQDSPDSIYSGVEQIFGGNRWNKNSSTEQKTKTANLFIKLQVIQVI